MRCQRRSRREREAGFTFLWVLVAIAVIGVGVSAASEMWVASANRQRLVEVEWIGEQYTQAIGSYYQATPGPAKAYPKSLEDLLEDGRYPTVRRHLRTLYANPFSGKPDWDVVRGADGRVRGVRVALPGDRGGSRDFIYSPVNADQ